MNAIKEDSTLIWNSFSFEFKKSYLVIKKDSSNFKLIFLPVNCPTIARACNTKYLEIIEINNVFFKKVQLTFRLALVIGQHNAYRSYQSYGAVFGLSVPLLLLSVEAAAAVAVIPLPFFAVLDKLATSFNKLLMRLFKKSTLSSCSFWRFFSFCRSSFSVVKLFAFSSVIWKEFIFLIHLWEMKDVQ